MNKVILFSRVSTLGQDLTQQNDELYAEAKINGYDEKDGITSVGKYIDIYMIDGTKHSIHMSKKGNNFITKVIYKDEERPLDDLKIITRFVRKKY